MQSQTLMNVFDEEESEWNSSKIKGFSFGDDEEVNSKRLTGIPNYKNSIF